MSSEHIDKVPDILLEEFDRQEGMRQAGIMVASTSERDDWFGIDLRFREFGAGWVGRSEISIKKDAVTEDVIRERIAGCLRFIWEQYGRKAVKQ